MTDTRFLRRIAVAVSIGVLELALALAVTVAVSGEASAQRYRRSTGFFESLFGPSNYGNYGPVERARPAPPPVESSRAPPPKKSETTPTVTVMVMGDGLADWLAYGLEEAFADSPEIGIVRKTRLHSGLIRYEPKSDLDWWHVARDDIANERADYVVMMLGVEDRQNIRMADDKKAKADQAAKKSDQNSAPNTAADTAADDQSGEDVLVAPEPKPGIRNGIAEFRSEAWEQIYTKRIDDTIAAMKSKGVPVLWVGLPSIRGTKSTADAVYLNDLYRARAEKAGIVYVDIWDGFVDDNGKFTYFGPDFEGQNRRLRAGDGVNFTKNGARKLAHYVERELRRFMSNRSLPVAMPAGPQGPTLSSGPAARPVAGPVLPLTGVLPQGDELLGGSTSRPALADAVANQVLVKGEPISPAAGRADDFHWPLGSDRSQAPAAPSPVATTSPATAPAAGSSVRVIPEAPQSAIPAAETQKPAHEANREPASKAEAPSAAKPSPARSETPKSQAARPVAPAATKPAQRPEQRTVDRYPRPPAPVQQAPHRRNDGGLFGLFR